MTKDVKVARREDTVQESMRRMSQGRFRHLPIVDRHNFPVGILSQGDFVAYTWYDVVKRLGTTTRSSFFTYTQIWMILLGILLYSLAMVFFLK